MSTTSRPLTFDSTGALGDRTSQWRRVPAVTRDALRLVWAAGRRQMLATTILQVVGAAMVGAQLLVGKRLLQELFAVSGNGRPASSLLGAFALLIAVTVVAGLVTAITANQQRHLSELVGRYTFDRIIDVSATVPLEAFETPGFYDQLTRARSAGMFRPIEMVSNVTSLSMALLTSVGVAGVLVTIEPLLVPFVGVAVVPLLVSALYNGRQAYQFEYSMTPQGRERMYLMDVLTGRDTAKEIRVFGATRFLRRRYDALTNERLVRLREFLAKRLQVAVIGTVANAFGTAIALGALGFFLTDGRIDVASAVAAGIALQLLAGRLRGMTASLGKLIEAGMFLDDFQAFLDLGKELTSRSTEASAVLPAAPPRPFRGLELHRVCFTYPNTSRPVLENIDLHVEPGEIVALVGENGSGKTTLVKLICQLYRAQAGRILWNGEEAAEFGPELVRSDMTVIFQDYIQYHLSARDNIALGRVEREPTDEAVLAAAAQGGAADFLSQLPHGYETRLGRQFYRGHELSVGQWQRLALARAFFRGGGFLILDEPTASLDPRAEHELFRQMRELAAGRSVLMVSHRFSSVRTADRIYVMQEGRITEHGSHAELMALGGHYAELFQLQASAYLGGDRPAAMGMAASA